MNAKRKTKSNGSSLEGRIPVVSLMIMIVLLLVSLVGCSNVGSSVLTQDLLEPLSGVKNAKVVIDPGDGNLTIDQLIHSEQELASGTLQYLENRGQPVHTVETTNNQAILTLKASGGQPMRLLPWEACNGATDWHIHLNPKVTSDLTAHTDGGNIKLNLAGMVITHLLMDTGGGDMDVVLPDQAADLNATVKTGGGNITIEIGSDLTGSSTVSASSGAGNVMVRLPGNITARIHAASGMGKIIVDSRFSKVDDTTYQSPDYDSATDKVEITVESGAGNVTIEITS
jgi:hypothetical protein